MTPLGASRELAPGGATHGSKMVSASVISKGADDSQMASPEIPVDLPAEACEVALGPYIEGASLRPESRAAIERAPGHALGIEYRVVTCKVAEAQDMLDYFRSTADVLITLGDARAGACAVALDNLRLALRLARILPPL
jgi:hypothetical protein